jgi:hypothetical protein
VTLQNITHIKCYASSSLLKFFPLFVLTDCRQMIDSKGFRNRLSYGLGISLFRYLRDIFKVKNIFPCTFIGILYCIERRIAYRVD